MKLVVPFLCLVGASPSSLAFGEEGEGIGQLTSPKRWILSSWTAKPPVPEAVAQRPWISFRKGKFNGMAGINQVSGGYQAEAGGSLTIGPLIATEMAGPPAAMKTEQIFLKLLTGVTQWKMNGENLVLSNGTPKLEIRFQLPAAQKDLPLFDTKWILKGIEETEGETVSFTAPLPNTTLTFSLKKNGQGFGSSGVNGYTGRAKLGEEQQFKFAVWTQTLKAGPKKHLEQEAHFLKRLHKVTLRSIDGKQLVLTDDERTFGLIFEAPQE